MLDCVIGIKESTDDNNLIYISDDFYIDSSSTITTPSFRIPVIAGSTETNLCLECFSEQTDEESRMCTTVQVTQYTGSDVAEQEATYTEALVTELETFFEKEDADIESAEAEQLLSQITSMSTLMNNFDKEKSKKNTKKVLKVLKNVEIDTSDKKKNKKVLSGFSAAINSAQKGGMDEGTIEQLDQFITTFFGSYEQDNRRNLATTSNTVKSMSPKRGDDSVVQLDSIDCKQLANSVSKMMEGVDSNKDLVTEVLYEKTKKLSLIMIDKMFKSCMNTLAVEKTLDLPFKEYHLFAKKLSLQQAEIMMEHEFEYTCPCSDSYKPTTLASDSDATSGNIDISVQKTQMTMNKRSEGTGITTTGSLNEAQGGKLKRATAEGMCKVSIPSVNQLPATALSCSSLMAVVTTTKNMCPNSELSTSDSNQMIASDGSSLTEVSASNAGDLYEQAYSNSDSCQTSDYEQMACTGSSIEVSFYCAKSSSADSSNKMTVERLSIIKLENEGSIEYSMNCPAASDTYSDGQSEEVVFYNEYTGENSCSGCKTTETGTVKCTHATSFGYAKATVSTAKSDTDWWERVYKNFVLYLMLAIDLYFCVALVVGLIKKDKRQQVKVLDVSRLPVDEASKGNKAEQASSYHDGSQHSKHDNEELYRMPIMTRIKNGILLKYRLLTPFTTNHELLTRIARAAVNVLVIYMIWVFSGLILYGIQDVAGSYCVAILLCFIIARISAFVFEYMLKNRNNKPLRVVVFVAAFLIAVVLHLSVFLITEAMGSEFSDWGVLVLICLIVDLILWEIGSMFVQLYISKKLASSPDTFVGKRKFMEKLVTPPLLKAFLEG